MSEEYYTDYPKSRIGGGNPYYKCSSCGISDPQINGQLDNHADNCKWVEEKLKKIQKVLDENP